MSASASVVKAKGQLLASHWLRLSARARTRARTAGAVDGGRSEWDGQQAPRHGHRQTGGEQVQKIQRWGRRYLTQHAGALPITGGAAKPTLPYHRRAALLGRGLPGGLSCGVRRLPASVHDAAAGDGRASTEPATREPWPRDKEGACPLLLVSSIGCPLLVRCFALLHCPSLPAACRPLLEMRPTRAGSTRVQTRVRFGKAATV